ncbi:DUF6166 domain-containing protein [Rubrivirga litoralis]|uniref:DUF6166 domain-containing protein n=1 Tax=Rubrivirga litoralis TaxID=3075598 RepID=A0ABU3BRP2_9BACT|nr:DUF6166 domain-containing protein [Rubrivirga sp. F394]MDT0631944.1 DUF6166 domain-containing protein [Rubrivirga sp. F394]
MTTHALAHRPSRTSGIQTQAGTHIPAADVHARQIAREAERWLAFATERTRMKPGTLTAKALGACAFSVQKQASSLAVPSKLTGTSRHQPRLRALANDPEARWAALDLDAVEDGLRASHGGAPLGLVQTKHLGWVRPLIPFGLTVYLSRVTGTGNPAAAGGGSYRLGCNVAFGHVGEALRRLADGASGGDGASTAPSVDGRSPLRLVVPSEARPIGVPVRPEYEALTGDAEDVVLWRTLEGKAHASVPHAARHSPTGIEWGYGGSGPADLALSVLLALTDEQTANTLYHRFKHEVVAAVPDEGGVLRAADVRRWVQRAR